MGDRNTTLDPNFLREAIAQDDAARRDYEAWRRRRATQQPKKQRKDMMAPMDGEDREDFLDRCVAEGNDSEDCAVWFDEYKQAPKSQQRNVAVMAPEIQKGWDAWVRAHIRNNNETVIGALAEEIGACIGEGEKLLRKKIEGINQLRNIDNRRADERINELMHAVNALREQVEALRAINKGEVIDLPAGWRSRDAAA